MLIWYHLTEAIDFFRVYGQCREQLEVRAVQARMSISKTFISYVTQYLAVIWVLAVLISNCCAIDF